MIKKRNKQTKKTVCFKEVALIKYNCCISSTPSKVHRRWFACTGPALATSHGLHRQH